MRRSVLFCYTGFLIAAFSYMSAAQTSLNSISATKSDSSSKQAVEPETLGVSHPTKVKVAPLMQSKLVEARQLAETGATSFFVGIGIEYLLVTPLAIVGATNNNPGLIIGALIGGLVASGFEISDRSAMVLELRKPMIMAFKMGWPLKKTLTGLIIKSDGDFQRYQEFSVWPTAYLENRA